MREKEKAAPVDRTEGGGGQQTVLSDFELSKKQCTTQAGEKQATIAGLLMTGAENGITLSQLAELTGRDTRTVRLLIRQDRAKGYPICTDNAHGYYMPSSGEEKSECVRSLLHRAAEIFRTASDIERAEVD